MIQYDAGPGDLSDRPWEDPERKPRPQARRRRVTLPPWALLAIFIAIVILLCLGLYLILNAVRGDDETPTPSPTLPVEVAPSATLSLLTPTSAITPTSTVVLTVGAPPVTSSPTELGPGALAVITGTGGAGLRLRALATTDADVLAMGREGTVVTVLEGPVQADDFVWWKVRTPDGDEGWAAANWLVLKTEE